MRTALFIRERSAFMLNAAEELSETIEKEGIECSDIFSVHDPLPAADMILSMGGDGTLLSLLPIVRDSGIPILGVNYGRLGFLSSSAPMEVGRAIASGKFSIEKRSLVHVPGVSDRIYPYALNELAIHRIGAAMLGIEVSVDGAPLPTYWADGILVATSSGSTAYSLSVGGPIVFPGSRVLIISPIAPHNLNVRPIVLPDTSRISLKLHSRDSMVSLSLDNRQLAVPGSISVDVSLAGFTFNIVRISGGGFIKALTGKLFWGYDLRNNNA